MVKHKKHLQTDTNSTKVRGNLQEWFWALANSEVYVQL